MQEPISPGTMWLVQGVVWGSGGEGHQVHIKEYWAFVMSSEGHAIDLIGLDCKNEEDARERARQLVSDKPVELWDGPRRIARFSPTL